MMRMWKATAAVIVVFMALSAGAALAAGQITPERALDIALAHAKVSRQNIYDVDVDYEGGYGGAIYEVEFKSRGYEYKYYIDAASGAIRNWKREWDD